MRYSRIVFHSAGSKEMYAKRVFVSDILFTGALLWAIAGASWELWVPTALIGGFELWRNGHIVGEKSRSTTLPQNQL